MRYQVVRPSVPSQPRSRRIGRCARCHAPVLSEEEHYGVGEAIVHGACGAQPHDPTEKPRPRAVAACPDARSGRRARYLPGGAAPHSPQTFGKLEPARA